MKKKNVDDEEKDTKKKEKIKNKKEGIEEESKNNNTEIREIIVEKKVGFNYLEVILIMIIMLILGGFLGGFIAHFEIDKDSDTSTTTVSSISTQFKEFIDTYNDILENYYEDVNKDELLDAGIEGMLEYLDDEYSIYMNEEETEAFNEQVEGKYVGIGVEISQNDTDITISKIFNNTPASKAGLQVGDKFIEVNGENVEDKTVSELSTFIRSITDQEFKVIVIRNGKEIEFTLNCEEVEIESVTSKIYEKNGKKVGYINISIFASNTYSQFLSELTDLELKDIDSLIIDVRGNTGGYLTTVTNIASLFLKKNKIIYQLDTKGVVEKVRDTNNISKEYPITVLINKGSASASEILTACLKESYGAEVVGTYSYGKGTVQRAYQLESGATVKYTIQKWLTPNGNWINEVGVEPTVTVELDDNYTANPSENTDNQLQKALELMSNSDN